MDEAAAKNKGSDECLSALFNRLSFFDKWKLRGAALSRDVTSIVRDDTKRRPWTFPLYAGFLTFIAIPIPIPFSNLGPLLLMAAIAKTRLTPWARWVDDRLKNSFNPKALIADHRDYIKAHPQDERPYVDGALLARGCLTNCWNDVKEAASDATAALGRVLLFERRPPVAALKPPAKN